MGTLVVGIKTLHDIEMVVVTSSNSPINSRLCELRIDYLIEDG